MSGKPQDAGTSIVIGAVRITITSDVDAGQIAKKTREILAHLRRRQKPVGCADVGNVALDLDHPANL